MAGALAPKTMCVFIHTLELDHEEECNRLLKWNKKAINAFLRKK